jgi:hypothetical protein
MFFMGYLTLIMFEFYHVLIQGQTFDLLLDQSSQPLNYLFQIFSQHFVHDLNYLIFQLQAFLDVCVHISLTL